MLKKLIHILLNYPQYKKENSRNSQANYSRIIVVGRNYCSNLSMARALGQAGYEVEVLRVFSPKARMLSLAKYIRVDAYSKYIKAFYTCSTYGNPEAIVEKLIAIADKKRKMLLIPVDDLVADIVDTYSYRLGEYYILPNVNGIAGELSRLMNKQIQKELAYKFGLPVLKSCNINTCNGKFDIPNTVSYPCFVKPNISKNAFKTHMKKCECEEELKRWLTKISKNKDIEVLVEDFVDIDKEYALLGISTKNGVIAPGYLVIDEGGHGPRRGIAMTGRIVSCSGEKDLIDSITNFIGTLKFEGLFDVDLIKTKDGRIFFTELNLRFGGSGYAVTKGGINLPGMYADYVLKGKVISLDCDVIEVGKRFINEKIMFEEYVFGFLTKKEMKEKMDLADIHFVKDDGDPKAYSHLKIFLFLFIHFRWLIRIVVRYIKKVRHW